MGKETEETAPSLLNELAAVYGKCLWNWSCIETELLMVFIAASGMVLVSTEAQETLARAFFAVKGFEIRLAMTHALAQQRWKKSPHLATWKTIHKKLDKQRRVRGQIGHKTGLVYANPDSSKPPIAVIIEPTLHIDMAISYQDAKKRGISLVKLLNIHMDFIELRTCMVEFLFTLAREQHGASPQPQAGPPHPLHTEDDQTPKEAP